LELSGGCFVADGVDMIKFCKLAVVVG